MAARLNERFRWTVGQAPALGNAICMNYSRRFFSTLRGRTRANRRQHSIIPFVLALNEIVRISWIVCSIVIAGSPYSLPSFSAFLLPVCTYHPLFFFFFLLHFVLLHQDRCKSPRRNFYDRWRQGTNKKTNLWKWPACSFSTRWI